MMEQLKSMWISRQRQRELAKLREEVATQKATLALVQLYRLRKQFEHRSEEQKFVQ